MGFTNKVWNAFGIAATVGSAVSTIGQVAIMTIAFRNRPRQIEIFAQPTRSQDVFEIVVRNKRKRRIKIERIWIELTDGSPIYPIDDWRTLNASINSEKSKTFKVPIKSMRKYLTQENTQVSMKACRVQDDTGKAYEIQIPRSIKQSLNS